MRRRGGRVMALGVRHRPPSTPTTPHTCPAWVASPLGKHASSAARGVRAVFGFGAWFGRGRLLWPTVV
jgi:hypothetical protein